MVLGKVLKKSKEDEEKVKKETKVETKEFSKGELTEKPLISLKRVVKKPLNTEKAADLQKFNQYLFLVEKSANKKMIKNEISHRYNVRVTNVNIIYQKGKLKRYGYRFTHRPDFKKAIVTLAEGEKIDLTVAK